MTKQCVAIGINSVNRVQGNSCMIVIRHWRGHASLRSHINTHKTQERYNEESLYQLIHHYSESLANHRKPINSNWKINASSCSLRDV